MRVIFTSCYLFKAVCITITILFLPTVWADCAIVPTGIGENTYINLPVSLTVPSDIADGSVVWSSEWIGPGTNTVQCSSSSQLWLSSLISFISSENYTWQTGVKGIVMRIYYRDQTRGIKEHMIGKANPLDKRFVTDKLVLNPEFKIELLKTQQVTSGKSQISGGNIRLKVNNLTLANVIVNATPLTIGMQGCDVLSDNIIVNLGEHNEKEFTGKGSSTRSQPFFIPLKCNGNVRISYAVNGFADSHLYEGVLKLDKEEGSAKGIGVQLLTSSGVPVNLNQYKHFKDISTDSRIELGLKARYIQIGNAIEAGSANATATVSFIYR